MVKMTPDDILETLRRLLVNAVLGALLAAVVAFGFMFAIGRPLSLRRPMDEGGTAHCRVDRTQGSAERRCSALFSR
jgi:hypothetical protein